ncbi:hypothetical protein HHI36_014503 [Cryptolaemus montrouzieri]|uniref:Uncharacterized protein n=1 Tax=Cryptolaemus montrouzieri TaxID=559131 RepID=A0ABD2N3B7_9CUCU
MTTDGASVTVKGGTLVPCYRQLCVAHGIQLSVNRKKSDSEVDPMERSSIEMDDDDNHEWSIMKDLIASLQLFKLAVETLCRRESILLTADTVLEFIIDKLGQKDIVLGNDLSDALRVEIKEQ